LKNTGAFEIDESFYITNRGIVLVGYCSNRFPKVGMFVAVPILDKIETFKIIGISMGNRPRHDKEQFGLVIQTTPEMTKYITENKIINGVAELFSE
jgi:hypothetical protein